MTLSAEHKSVSPLLRWSGSKAKLVSVLSSAIPQEYSRYIEPFAGSACLFFRTQPHFAILGDVNEAVIDLYSAVQEEPAEVHRVLAGLSLTPESYYALRALDRNTLTLPQRAAQMIFLMKACFNGVYRTNKLGKFNVPMGSRVYALPSLDQLMSASMLLRRCDLVAGDFEESLAPARAGDFVYLDPPYRHPGRYRGEYGYGACFEASDLDRLIRKAQELAGRGVFVMLSYAHDEAVIERLSGWFCRYESVRRTVAGGAKFRAYGDEVILTNYPQTK